MNQSVIILLGKTFGHLEQSCFLKENYSTTDLEIKKHLQFPRMKMHNNQKIKEHLPVFFVKEELLIRDTINFRN